ncbi:uncharacterized protein LOC103706229 [Phoenix dactylifera]|uniref:Uncharacterized protein LOC103706229 n=1 Tax=Phoenix dactylifera TaxID=42345 RepID=A0A8B7BZA0_PHODC|nr:uncharacterized protein LOC103706229 [Phoenix dactylifera]
METMGSAGELSSGYKLVPWSSWDQWNFVRESIFSSSSDSVAAALRRISAWRSRGCLPVPIEITAAFVEIQQKDPFFSKEPMVDALSSEEMLAMLYSMAITRLVNGYVEPAHKKTGRSISELAEAVGIPRMLVDIRHESSHRNLPSIRLVRLAGIKALDWLKSNYWEPQKKMIPDVRKEIRSRLHEMTYYLKTKSAQKSSSEVKGKCVKRRSLLTRCNKLSLQITGMLLSSQSKGSEKKISKTARIITRLYSAYPTEVASVLLELFHLQAPDFSDGTDMEISDDSDVGDPWPLTSSVHVLKTIITTLSDKKPRLLLSILKMVLETIEAKESVKYENGQCYFLSPEYQAEICQLKHLCSLVPWLLTKLRALKDAGRIGLINKNMVLSTDRNSVPKVSLTKLLRKCLTLSVTGDKHLTDSVMLLAEMIGNNSLKERLKKLPLLGSKDWDSIEDPVLASTETMCSQEEDSLKIAAAKLELLKLQFQNHSNRSTGPVDGNTDTSNMWTLAKSWIPCPIGMLPCSFSSTAVLPVLDKVDEGLESMKIEINNDKAVSDQATNKSDLDSHTEPWENGSAIKKLKPTLKEQELDFPEIKFPMEGRLLIDGIWKKVSEQELLAIESNIRIFV